MQLGTMASPSRERRRSVSRVHAFSFIHAIFGMVDRDQTAVPKSELEEKLFSMLQPNDKNYKIANWLLDTTSTADGKNRLSSCCEKPAEGAIEREAGVRAGDIRRPGERQEEKSGATGGGLSASQPLKAGMQIEAKSRSKGRYCPGKIGGVSGDGTFDILFEIEAVEMVSLPDLERLCNEFDVFKTDANQERLSPLQSMCELLCKRRRMAFEEPEPSMTATRSHLSVSQRWGPMFDGSIVALTGKKAL